MFPDFVPIELRGMSIITALIFCFIGVAAGFMWSVMKREFKRINNEIERHEAKIDKGNNDISEMKTNIALTLQSIQNIEKFIERLSK